MHVTAKGEDPIYQHTCLSLNQLQGFENKRHPLYAWTRVIMKVFFSLNQHKQFEKGWGTVYACSREGIVYPYDSAKLRVCYSLCQFYVVWGCWCFTPSKLTWERNFIKVIKTSLFGKKKDRTESFCILIHCLCLTIFISSKWESILVLNINKRSQNVLKVGVFFHPFNFFFMFNFTY